MGTSQSTSSSPTNFGKKYDLFVSFRGEDIRYKFKSHLCDALSRQQIDFFVDNILDKGDEIWPALSKAIEESNISLVIFSKHYATSKWCLRELVKILECKRTNKQIVIPVFYHVNPSSVRKQTGIFGNAILNQENVSQEEKQMWKAALTEASKLTGWHSSVIRDESKFVNEVVNDVSKKLNEISTSSDFEGLVGINSRIEKVQSLLCNEMLDFRVVGIWGMGGIGKTTIVGAVFNQIFRQFQGYYFIANVRESERCGRLVHIRDKAISQILEQNIKANAPNLPSNVKERLQKKKVLIVLDDVNNLKQLEFLAGGLDQLGPGSRVIITTRDRQLLCNYGVEFIYKVELFKYHQALQLFCKYAFKGDHPPEDFMMFTDKVVNYANGNPLALIVVGSSLYQKPMEDWKSALHKLEKISNVEINNLLRISYDILDSEEKDIFLDVACFFKGERRDFVTDLLNGCYFSVQFGLSRLVDKSLITISIDNRIEMHDLLQKMGWEIVREESFNKPGERSRLHDEKDVCLVLQRNTGTEAIKGIFLNMSVIQTMNLSSRAFKKLCNVRFLKFYQWNKYCQVHLPQGLKYLSDELRYLHWVGYPSRVLPSNLNLENLIHLDLSYSKVEQLWNGKKHAPKLKQLILSYSEYLTTIPDLSDSPCLEVIDLKYCERLHDISSSIQRLNNLHYLYLEGCKCLRSFSRNVHFKSLITLDLSFCTNLNKFPQISGNIRELRLRWTGIEEVSSSIENLAGISVLDLSDCAHLKHISTIICKLDSLEDINLSGTAIREVTMSSLTRLRKLRTLHLSGCKSLTFPSLSGKLCSLKELLLNKCYLMELPEDIGCLSSLEKLELGGNEFKSLPKSMKQLSKLRKLYVNDCNELQSLTDLPSGLEYLEAINCEQLQSSPNATEFAQVVSERCMNGVPYFNWIFINSPKLNQKALSDILAESLKIIQHRATGETQYERGIDLGICYPGSEMPEWFHTRSEIPQHNWGNRNFLGLAICAVVAFHRHQYDDNYYMTVPYKCHFETSHCTSPGTAEFRIQASLIEFANSSMASRSTFQLNVFLILAFAATALSTLSPYYYEHVCPQALPTIKRVVEAAVYKERRMGASLLRLHFHDCFVNGCDASLLLDATATMDTEKNSAANRNSARGFEVIDQIKMEVDKICGRPVVSCADILAVAARDSVVALGGPSWSVLLGRRDSATASIAQADADIPSPFMDLPALIDNFKRQGLDEEDLVALSGGHTIGFAQCRLFRNRIYNETNIDPQFAKERRQTCPSNGGDSNLAPLDPTPAHFDIGYFTNLVNKKGLLHSDQQLFSGGSTDEIVKNYSHDPEEFSEDFAESMVKMGNIKVLTGEQGQIRVNCRKAN